jgi:hypothetical protein
MISSFHNKDLVRVDKFDTVLLLDVCRYKSKEIGFEVMGQGKSNQGGT